MPFLRVIRDKRGYETTYLMEWYQEQGRPRSRVLYAFRGPGGVRVGRSPLEPGVLRELQAQYPQISFDWKTIFADKQVIESAPEVRRRRPRRDEGAEPSEPAVPNPSPPPAPAPAPASAVPAAPPERPAAIPSVIAGTTPEERLAFLAEWYPVVRDRVARRTTDEARRDALLTLAERLNAEAWPVDGSRDDGLAQAAEALERLARVLTRRRRRAGKRRGGGAAGQGEAATPQEPQVALEDASGSDPASDDGDDVADE